MLGAGVFWVAIIALSFIWNQKQINQSMKMLSESEVRTSFNKDVVYRKWATMHGGVYVPPTDATPPNPYLTHIPNRDITSTTGLSLTLMNPAYMTRQVHELGQELYGLRGHITSLNPIRPENKADDWEADALRAFENGLKEKLSVEIIDGGQHLRFMRPFITEAGCLKCHAKQGYKVGDIRGGISISTPISHYIKAERHQMIPLIIAHLFFVLLGLAGLVFANRILRNSERNIRNLTHEREIDRMKNEFVSTAAHEMRTPLTSIQGFSEILLHRDNLDEKDKRKYLEFINKKAIGLSDIVNDLFDMSCFDSGQKVTFKKTSCDFNPNIEALVMRFQGMSEKHTLELEMSEAPVDLLVDVQKMEQVVNNILSNAIKFSPGGGNIAVKTAIDNDHFVISISDEGLGMTQEQMGRIFDKFYRVDASSTAIGGIGIGMSIVKNIVEGHGGTVLVESELGKGTVVRVRLPLVKENIADGKGGTA